VLLPKINKPTLKGETRKVIGDYQQGDLLNWTPILSSCRRDESLRVQNLILIRGKGT